MSHLSQYAKLQACKTVGLQNCKTARPEDWKYRGIFVINPVSVAVKVKPEILKQYEKHL